MGTACQIRGRRVALTGSSGSFGSAMKDRLERAGAVVVPLRFGVDFTYDDYSGADSVLATADILVLAHGAKGEQAMQANCDSFLALIERFKGLTRHRQVPVEVWAVGSEIECHPAFGVPSCNPTPAPSAPTRGPRPRLCMTGTPLSPHRAVGLPVPDGRWPDEREDRRRNRLLADPPWVPLCSGDLHRHRLPQLLSIPPEWRCRQIQIIVLRIPPFGVTKDRNFDQIADEKNGYKGWVLI